MIEPTKKEQVKFQTFQKGGEHGFDYFFTEYYPALTFFAFKILKNETIAEDVVSETFVKLWEKREVFNKSGSIRSYLYTSVKNACIDELRNNKRYSNYSHSFEKASDISEGSILHKLIEAEVLRYLFDAKSRLPPKNKLVVEMYYFENRSYQEIAEEMNISIHTVKNQKLRAIRQLGKQFPYIIFFLHLMEHNHL